MNYSYQPKNPNSRYTGLAIVALLHVFLLWAIISGTAQKGLAILKKPLEAVVIQEVIIPPPPPPPPPPKEIKPPEPQAPKVEAPPPFIPPPDVVAPPSAAPAIASTTVAPTAPVVIAPPPPPAPPAPVARPAPNRSDIGVACPTQTPPEMPRKALQDGVEGVVRAQALIKDGVVKDVTILSGPRVFHAAVKTAMMQYKCTNDGGAEVVATQEFNFKIQ